MSLAHVIILYQGKQQLVFVTSLITSGHYVSHLNAWSHKRLSDLLSSAVLLGHVGQSLLLLGVVIQLPPLLLQLLPLLLLLCASTGQTVRGDTDVLMMSGGRNCNVSSCWLRSYRKSGLPLLLPLCPDPLLLSPLCTTFLLQHIQTIHSHGGVDTREAPGSFPEGHTHNSVHKGNELLLLFLPLDEVSLDQRLQLSQIFLLTLPVDVLPSDQNTLLEMIVLFAKATFLPGWWHLIISTHIKIHFLSIRDLWGTDICHKPTEGNSFLLYLHQVVLQLLTEDSLDAYFGLGFESSSLQQQQNSSVNKRRKKKLLIRIYYNSKLKRIDFFFKSKLMDKYWRKCWNDYILSLLYDVFCVRHFVIDEFCKMDPISLFLDWQTFLITRQCSYGNSSHSLQCVSVSDCWPAISVHCGKRRSNINDIVQTCFWYQ